MTTKIEIVLDAYGRGRISGLTRSPTPKEIRLGLRRLESMARRWAKKNICVGYNFEENPQPNSVHNIPEEHWDAFQSGLMMALLANFGKEPTMALSKDAGASYSDLVSATAVVRPVGYPSRQPRGRGNRRWTRYYRYYRNVEKAPIECATEYMAVDDVDDFYEDFEAYLNDGETIASYVLTSDDGLDISAENLDSPRIEYRVTATGVTSTQNGVFQVKIVATTSDTRITTRIKNFVLTEVDID